jgi:hypothetical protein
MGVDMKSRTSTALRIRVICEYTILRTFMTMFSFLVAMFSFPAVFLTSWACFADGAFHQASEAGVSDTGMHFFTKSLDGT